MFKLVQSCNGGIVWESGLAAKGAAQVLSCLVLIAFLSPFGCTQTLDAVRAEAATAYAKGQFSEAARTLDTPEAVEAHAARNRLLWNLERASLALYLRDYDRALALFDDAENDAAYQYDPNAVDVLAQWTFNDTGARYTAQPYEDMYISVMKQIAYLAQGRIDGFATAESRRHLGKAAHLRDVYGKYMTTLTSGSRGEYVNNVGNANAPQVTKDDEGQFIESTLGTYLAMMIFTHTGEANLQEQTARSLRDAVQKQRAFSGGVDLKNLERNESLRPGEFNVVVVALSGRGPTKVEGSLRLAGLGIPIEYPKLVVSPHIADGAYLEVEGQPGASDAQPLFLIEDFGLTAVENYRRAEPVQYARTLIRLGAKLGLVTTATIVANNQEATREYTALIAAVGALAVWASEQADLRCWSMLPGQARVGHHQLPPGSYRVRVRYDRGGTTVFRSPWETISVSSGKLTTVVTHFPGGG